MRQATIRSTTFERRRGASTSSARRSPSTSRWSSSTAACHESGANTNNSPSCRISRAGSSPQMQRCIDQGLFPSTVDAEVGLRLIWASILGIAALRLSERLPHEDADNLVLDAIDTTIAGLRAGAPSRSAAVGPMQPVPSFRGPAHHELSDFGVLYTMRGTISLVLPFLFAAAAACGTDVKGESAGRCSRAASRGQQRNCRRAADSTLSRGHRDAGRPGRSGGGGGSARPRHRDAGRARNTGG